MKTQIWIRVYPAAFVFIFLGLVLLAAGPRLSNAESTVLIDNTTPAFYNTDLDFLLDGTDMDRFPLAGTFVGEHIIFTTAPDLSPVDDILGNWLTSPVPELNGYWSALQVIPVAWPINTENAIVYALDAGGGASDLLATFYVDNGIHIWVNGAFQYGARDPLGTWYYDIPLGNLAPGLNHIQVLREDSGGIAQWAMSITGSPAPLPGTSCELVYVDHAINAFGVAIRNQQTGLSDISVAPTNANVDIPSFDVGTTEPVIVAISKVDVAANALARFAIEDLDSEQLPCDWANVVKQGSEVLTLEGVTQAQPLLTIHNGVPGFKKLHVTVEGETLSFDRLSDDFQLEQDISQLLTTGDDTIQVRGFGPPGTSATLLVSSGELDSM
ncbi:MAG: hypothetical protein HKO88_00240 [Xanthomonadales bacterium]|nr:hypothetical protein [Xanthomonadales bacterium]